MSSIDRHILQIKQKLSQIMAVDQYYLSRELDILEGSERKDESASWKKISSLHRAIDLSLQRYRSRARSVPRLHFPPQLPISSKRSKIIDSIKNEQVVIITGETGSGKTTQIPKMCLASGLGLRGMIGHASHDVSLPPALPGVLRLKSESPAANPLLTKSGLKKRRPPNPS